MNSSFGVEVNPSGSSRGGLATKASLGIGEKKKRKRRGERSVHLEGEQHLAFSAAERDHDDNKAVG